MAWKNKKGGNAYSAIISEVLSSASCKMLRESSEYRCLSCRVLFLYPWINPNQAKSLFETSLRHREGDRFESLRIALEVKYRRILPIISRVPLNAILVEAGCAKTSMSFLSARLRSWENTFEIIRFLVKGIRSLDFPSRAHFVYKATYFKSAKWLSIPRTIGWGGGSVAKSFCGCDRVLSGLTVIDYVDLKRSGLNNALLLIDNFFDHFDSPLRTLASLLDSFDTISIITHNPKGIGLQHKYAFDFEFYEALHEMLPMKDVRYFDTDVAHYLIISDKQTTGVEKK